jgi:hypothetical protein
MWQVLADGLGTGLADDLEAWVEYEQGSRNRKQVTFSRGLRRRYWLAEEETDEEIAEKDLGSEKSARSTGGDVVGHPGLRGGAAHRRGG